MQQRQDNHVAIYASKTSQVNDCVPQNDLLKNAHGRSVYDRPQSASVTTPLSVVKVVFVPFLAFTSSPDFLRQSNKDGIPTSSLLR